MNIAIIGAGNVGKALTGSAIRAGHSVTVSSAERRVGPRPGRGDGRPGGRLRTGRRSRAPTSSCSRSRTRPSTRCSARSATALDGKIVVDATNPIKADYSGLATDGTSGAEEIQAKVPGARVVKAFNTAFAARQADPTVAGGLRVDGYVAGDDEDAKATVLGLVEAIGFNPVDAGGLAMARHLEGMAWLNISLQTKHGWSWQAGWKLVGPDGDAA